MRPELLFAFLLLYGCGAADRRPAAGTAPPGEIGFYAYPYRDSMDTRDSLEWVDAGECLRLFREPNLSLRPATEGVFRMFILGGVSDEAFVTLHPDRIVVKENVGNAISYPYSEYDSLRDPLEQEHFGIMNVYYPFTGNYFFENKPANRRYLDSMLVRYPEMRDPAYYQQLKVKARVDKARTFRFTERTVPISTNTYRQLVKGLKDSGYFDLPFKVESSGVGADGGAVLAEWSGPGGYKMLHLHTLGNPEIPAARVFQQILDIGGVSARHHIWVDPKKVLPQKQVIVEEVELDSSSFEPQPPPPPDPRG